MTRTVLILGASGKLGRNAAEAFWNAGWSVRFHDRKTGDLNRDAKGAEVIVNGWNPAYPQWQASLPDLTSQVIASAKANGATVIIPGNVYVYGEDMPDVLKNGTPQTARNVLGQCRIDMERSYANSGVQTIILRAGDFIDTELSGNWFDRIIMRPLPRNMVYPGATDAAHAWAYLPDLARAMVKLAERRDTLPQFTDIGFSGYTLTGNELRQAVSDLLGQEVGIKKFPWWQIRLAAPVWPLARYLPQMRYLWDRPHRIDGSDLYTLLPEFFETPLAEALAKALPKVTPPQVNDFKAARA